MSNFELLLMRHAKSDSGAAGLSDHDRPLNARGRRDARRVGRWILEKDLVPGTVLCSTAVRAQQTLQGVVADWPEGFTVLDSDALYLAAPEKIVKVIASDSMDAQRVMVIGHNPGMEILAGHFSGACGHVPTAALLALSFKVHAWSNLNLGSNATVVAATRPKEME